MSNRVQKHGETIIQNTRSLISLRYHTVTKAINKEFWNSTSDILHSIYVGSYGRNTQLIRVILIFLLSFQAAFLTAIVI